MSSYAVAADFYDLLYEGTKDYDAEVELISDFLTELSPGASRILDVACGTGMHARHLTDRGFHVDGVDLEPAFVATARARCPEGTFRVADMMHMELGEEYDVVLSLFSAIGYARTLEGLRRSIERMATHVRPGGLLIVEPWFEPGQLSDRWVSMLVGETEELKVSRISRTLVAEKESIIEFEYLIGRPEGIERRSETHCLGLFTTEETKAAFESVGVPVTLREGSLRKRGLYIGRKTGTLDG